MIVYYRHLVRRFFGACKTQKLVVTSSETWPAVCSSTIVRSPSCGLLAMDSVFISVTSRLIYPTRLRITQHSISDPTRIPRRLKNPPEDMIVAGPAAKIDGRSCRRRASGGLHLVAPLKRSPRSQTLYASYSETSPLAAQPCRRRFLVCLPGPAGICAVYGSSEVRHLICSTMCRS